MNCQEARKLISEYLENELPESLSSEVKEHCESCSACSGELRAFEKMLGAIRGLKKVSAPEDLEARVRAALERRPLWARWNVSIPALAAAASFIIGALVGTQIAGKKTVVYYLGGADRAVQVQEQVENLERLREQGQQPVMVQKMDLKAAGRGGEVRSKAGGIATKAAPAGPPVSAPVPARAEGEALKAKGSVDEYGMKAEARQMNGAATEGAIKEQEGLPPSVLPPMNFRNADINDVSVYLMENTKTNILVDQRAVKKLKDKGNPAEVNLVTVAPMPLDDALDIVTDQIGMVYLKKTEYILITEKSVLVDTSPIETRWYKLDMELLGESLGADWTSRSVVNYLSSTLPESQDRKTVFDRRSETLVVTDRQANFPALEKIIQSWGAEPVNQPE